MSNLSKVLIGVIVLLILILTYETAFLLRLQHEYKASENTTTEYSFEKLLPNWQKNPLTKPDKQREYSQVKPFNNFYQFHNSLLNNDFFDDLFKDSFQLFDQFSLLVEPEINLSETKESYIVKANIPGVLKNNVKVEVEGNILSLSGSYEIKENNNQQSGSFYKTIPLPGEVTVDKVKTEYKNGLLIITLPKKHPGLKIEPKGDINLI